MQNLNICLSDIPEGKITTGKNGKRYVNMTVDTRRESDDRGNDLSVIVSQTKEERLDKLPKVYVGSGKTFNFERREPAPRVEYPITKEEAFPAQEPPSEELDDLPF